MKDNTGHSTLSTLERRRIQAFLAKGPGHRFTAIRWLRKRREAAKGISFPLGLAMKLVNAAGAQENRCE